jgi:hypothetical protein
VIEPKDAKFIFYAVYDKDANKILALRLTRKDARLYVDSEWGLLGVPKRIKVRRAKGVLFTT